MAKVKIQQVSTPGCPTCAWAKNFFETEIKPKFSEVEIEYVDALSEQGQELIQKHSIFAAPGIIINGELFASGSFDKEELIKKLL